MTAAQRATLESLARDAERYVLAMDGRSDDDVIADFHRMRADALRAALGTCGTCAHLIDGLCLTTEHGHPSAQQGRPMAITRPNTFGCTGWTAKEGA